MLVRIWKRRRNTLLKRKTKKETKHNRGEKRGEREMIPVGSFRSGTYEISSINQSGIINCEIYGSARGHIQSLKRGKQQKTNIFNMFPTNRHELFKASLRVKTGGKHTCYEFLWILKSTKSNYSGMLWDGNMMNHLKASLRFKIKKKKKKGKKRVRRKNDERW